MSGAATQLIRSFLKRWSGFDRVAEKVNILSAGNGECQAELKVEHEHTNPMGGLHGGYSATLVDIISSCALLTDKNGDVASVSVDMNLTYLKGATIGDEILINAKTLKSGKNVAFLEVEIKEKISGALLVKGSHTKYLLR